MAILSGGRFYRSAHDLILCESCGAWCSRAWLTILGSLEEEQIWDFYFCDQCSAELIARHRIAGRNLLPMRVSAQGMSLEVDELLVDGTPTFAEDMDRVDK